LWWWYYGANRIPLFFSFFLFSLGRKKGIPIVAGAAIKKASQSSETLPCAIPRPWRKRGDDDSDGDYDPNQEKRRSLSPLKQERRRSRRLSSSSKIRPIHKSPEVVDICDSESEIEEVGPPEPMAVRTRTFF